jgi:hypothetical protein
MLLERIGQMHPIPQSVLDYAQKIKHENYKVNTPSIFQKHNPVFEDVDLTKSFASICGLRQDRVDYVFFSAPFGADMHVDLLDPAKFGKETWVMPVLLPIGTNLLRVVDGEKEQLRELYVGEVYKFCHSNKHGLYLHDHAGTGCVLIMVAEVIA